MTRLWPSIVFSVGCLSLPLLAAAWMFGPNAIRSTLWSQEAAGWAQAIGSVSAIIVAIWLPEYQRRRERQAFAAAQTVAACRLAELAARRLAELHKRHSSGADYKRSYQYFVEETEAFTEAIDAIPLLSIEDERLIIDLVNLRSACNRSRRRMKMIKDGETPNPERDYFRESAERSAQIAKSLAARAKLLSARRPSGAAAL